ncbi:hypothetical protein ACZ91_70145 [Streptomyces regensis]|uniref:Uncharacterized protein n=1 Tax=Prauserella rugosa TaxID=43354 RepID=A0A660CAJ0_9PSEU|nr:hypothetical protein [Prauserella rugosa]KID28401.1 hypothetical protein HQ32_04306 [Prauserella sp. Am3]KMS65909.1 hypothetical protein ACZ91_70145 [Streptomyces regensis]TWH20578.1 hypothetical protein JD82_02424 [Prauserella rugosa]
MGKKHKSGKRIKASTKLAVALAMEDDPKAAVRGMIKAGQLKKKCCKSTPRCAKCPVMALQTAKTMRSKVSKAA